MEQHEQPGFPAVPVAGGDKGIGDGDGFQGEGFIFKALQGYRYLSWFLTSVFFIAMTGEHPLLFRCGVALSLLAAAVVTNQLYRQYWGQPRTTVMLVVVETAAVALVLLPTGGMDSIFLWYAINPILSAATTLSLTWSLTVLAGFLGMLALVVRYPFPVIARGLGRLFDIPTLKLMPDDAGPAATVSMGSPGQLLLIFLLVTLAGQVLANLVRTGSQRSRELARQRQELSKALETQAHLYQLINHLSMAEHPAEIADLTAGTALALTAAPTVALWLDREACMGPGAGSEPQLLAIAGAPLSGRDEEVLRALVTHWRGGQGESVPEGGQAYGRQSGGAGASLEGLVDGQVVVPIASTGETYGFLAAFPGEGPAAIAVNGSPEGLQAGREVLAPMAELAAAALERHRLQALNERLTIQGEQHRIAGELHDGVAQNLFNISTAAYALEQQWQDLPPATVGQQLSAISQAARQAARELRTSIYHLRAAHGGEGGFVRLMGEYLRQLESMHDVAVNFQVHDGTNDQDDHLSLPLRRALLRIVREACGNALRHGQCRRLDVDLKINAFGYSLRVADDGCGFDPEGAATGGKAQGGGMGLNNMRRLVRAFGGRFTVNSRPGRGTEVVCRIPALPQPSPAGQLRPPDRQEVSLS